MRNIDIKLPKKSCELLSIAFKDDNITLKTAFAAVDGLDTSWQWQSRLKISKRLGGFDGTSICDAFAAADFSFILTREFWQDEHSRFLALRYCLKNLSGKDFNLGKIRVFSSEKTNIKLSAKEGFETRAFIDRDEAMDCVPSAVRLDKFDDTYAAAVSGAVWDMESFEQVCLAQPHELDFENFCLLDDGEDSTVKLLLGFAELTHHYADMKMATDDRRTQIDYLTAAAVFDCVLPANHERNTGFFVFIPAASHNKALDAYTDIVGNLAGVTRMPDAPPPAVGCTWHYYGSLIDEKTVLDNLAAKQSRNIPLDVYMVDDFWEPFYGDWYAVDEIFPHGMRFIADRIREAGMRPGIWTAPFAVSPKSAMAKQHEDMLFKTKDGKIADFFGDYLIDPTAPGALRWIEELYQRLHNDYGFEYFKLDKLDFPHNLWRMQEPVCYDRTVTLVEAYRMFIAKIREAVGKDSYICICGGHYGASIGYCDTQRCSSDTYGKWGYERNGKFVPQQEFRLKQTLGRLHYRRLWQTNADGMEIRQQENSSDPKDFGLSVGLMTNDEARLMTIVHYITGGIIMCGESLVNIGDDRLKLYRHVIPSINTISRAVDLFNPWLPTQFVTQVQARCRTLGHWNTVSILNVSANVMNSEVYLGNEVTDGLGGGEFLLFELVTGTFIGKCRRGQSITISDIPPHAGRILKVIEVDNAHSGIYLLGTDLHNSGGGVEIKTWNRESTFTLSGTLDSVWPQYPVKITAAYVCDDGLQTKTLKLLPGNRDFFFDFH